MQTPHTRAPARALAAALLFATVCAPACAPSQGGSGTAPTQSFDAARAWKDLASLVALGPRQAGTEGAEAARAYLERELGAAGLRPIREAFQQTTPAGELAFANLYVDLPPAAEKSAPAWILLCTHYDTKRLPGGFVGANDGGSGTAVLLEVARSLAALPPRECGIRILFLDGEEAVDKEWVDPDNRYGSRHHAAMLKERGQIARFQACILLDMVGDKDLKLEKEGYSDARLYAPIADAARELGFADHISSHGGAEIIDDHRIFMDVGIRSVDLIDFTYGTAKNAEASGPGGPDNAWWHTLDDKLENCSQKSLEMVGRTLLAALPGIEKQLAGR